MPPQELLDEQTLTLIFVGLNKTYVDHFNLFRHALMEFLNVEMSRMRIKIARPEMRPRQTVPIPTDPGPSTFGNVLVWIDASGKENTYYIRDVALVARRIA